MDRFFKTGAAVITALFAAVFILVPMLILLSAAFTGEPIPLLEYLAGGHPAAAVSDFMDRAGWQYFAELLLTRRYRMGFLNSVGLVPLTILLAFLLVKITASAAGLFSTEAAKKIDRFSGASWMIGLGAAVLLWSLGWRMIIPADMQAHFFMRWLVPGRTLEAAMLAALGFCPAAALAAAVIGTAAAFCVKRTAMAWRSFFGVMCIVPLALPSFLGALAMKNLFGINGAVTKICAVAGLPVPFSDQSLASAFVTQVFLYFPFVMLTVSAALDRFSPSASEAAEVMGADGLFEFFTVRLPLLAPAIGAGAFLVFVRSLGDFAAISLLMPIKYPMMLIEAYRDLSGSTYWGGACMLSSAAVAIVLLVLFMQKYGAENLSTETVSGKASASENICRKPWVCSLALVFCTAVFAVPAAFIAVTFIVSIAGSWGIEVLPSSYTFDRYLEVWNSLARPHSPVINSLLLAGPGTIYALILAVGAAYVSVRGRSIWSQILDFVLLLPFVVPGVALAVALVAAFNGPPVALHMTPALVVISYVITSVPYGVRTMTAAFMQISRSMEENSLTLGADGAFTMAKVVLPLVRPGFLAAAVMIFISCMQEVAITIMTCPPDWRPVSASVFIEIQEGSVFSASAYGLTLFAFIVVPYALVWSFVSKEQRA